MISLFYFPLFQKPALKRKTGPIVIVIYLTNMNIPLSIENLKENLDLDLALDQEQKDKAKNTPSSDAAK